MSRLPTPTRRGAGLFAGLGVLALFVATTGAAPANGGSLAITTVDGQTVVGGAIPKPVKGAALTIAGTSDTTLPLSVDAGDSSFVVAGTPATLIGRAAGGKGPYDFTWSFGGSGSRFATPSDFQSTFDTTGLTGPITLNLRATDAVGSITSDTVKLFVYTTTSTTLLDVTASAGAGTAVLPQPGPPVPTPPPPLSPQPLRHPFDVPEGVETTSLDLVLSWNTSYQTPAVNFAGWNLSVENPDGVEVSEGQGAEFTEPEDVHLDDPVPGTWTAIAERILTAPDTYNLKVTAAHQPHNPVPMVSTPGPFDFTPTAVQRLTATSTGGTAPRTTAWDLDDDGVFETPDTADGVIPTPTLPLGTSIVSVKTTDLAGYEARETTAVRVGAPLPTAAPGIVVVAVSDTGINPYHKDFRATTFPDDRILALTGNFTKHPSTYIPGYPVGASAKQLTFDVPFASGKLYPAADSALWTRAATPLNQLFWVPGTKIIGVFDAGDSQPVNGAADPEPIVDEDGHGTASASVAVGNLYGYCPTCLLVFGENFAADSQMYSYPWVDLASNSFGAAANVGFAGLIDASHPKVNAERGQVALYAAGNGNENAFVTPEQTYTSENLGADWIVRVGAVDKADRKPIVGTGKPVDISSWGIGATAGPTRLAAASNTSPSGTQDHSGTSAATPYSTGVFGTVLGQVREALGDRVPGQKNAAPGDGVISRGAGVASSLYLSDGELTRAELVEAVFKTAEHDRGSDAITYPVTSPGRVSGVDNPAQYVVEGYGLVEPESGERALDVLMGRETLPERPAEDDFFAADSALRDELWGTWSGGGANSAAPQGPASPSISPEALAGITAASVASFDSAWAVLNTIAGPFQNDVLADAAAAQAAGGLSYWLHQTDCEGEPQQYLDTVNSAGDDDLCTFAGTNGVTAANPAGEWTTTTPVDRTIPTGTAVDGVLYVAAATPTDSIITTTLMAGGRQVGQDETDVVLATPLFLVAGEYQAVPIELSTTDAVVVGEDLTMVVTMDLSPTWSFGYEDDHASFLTFAVEGGGGGGGGGTLAATFTSPEAGLVVNPSDTPTVGVAGTATFPAGSAQVEAVRYYPFWGSPDGSACGVQSLEATPGTGDIGCAQTLQALSASGLAEFRESYPLQPAELPVTIAAGRAIAGTLTYGGSLPDPLHVITVQVIGTTPEGPRVLGSQQVQGSVIGILGLGPTTEFPFSIEVDQALAGLSLEGLSLDIVTEMATLSYMDRNSGASFVDLPLASDGPVVANSVQVSVDDATFLAPKAAALGTDGTWGYTLNVLDLDDGPHTIYARAVQDATASAPATLAIEVRRPIVTPPPAVAVQVQVVAAGGDLTADRWVNAVDASGAGDFSAWVAQLPLGAKGDYQLHARLLRRGEPVAAAAPVLFRKIGQ